MKAQNYLSFFSRVEFFAKYLLFANAAKMRQPFPLNLCNAYFQKLQNHDTLTACKIKKPWTEINAFLLVRWPWTFPGCLVDFQMLFIERTFPPSKTIVLQFFICRAYTVSFLKFSSLTLLENLISWRSLGRLKNHCFLKYCKYTVRSISYVNLGVSWQSWKYSSHIYEVPFFTRV